MSRSLFMTVFLFGCAGAATSPPGQPPPPIDGPSGEAASAGIVGPGVAMAAPWVAGDLELIGVTSDERAVYFDRSTGAVRMVALAVGAPETIAYGAPDQVRIDGQVVFVWSDGLLTARTPSGTRTLGSASYAGLAAASADGTALLYTDRTDDPPSASVYLDSAFGRLQLQSFDDPTQLRLRFAVDLWALVTVLVPGESGSTIAMHPTGEGVVLSTNVAAEPVLDASGQNVLLIDPSGGAMVRGTRGGLPVTLDEPVAEATFAGSDVVYRTPAGLVHRWTAAEGPTPLFAPATGLVGIAPDSRHALVQANERLAMIGLDGSTGYELAGSAAPGASFTRDGRWVIYAPRSGDGNSGLAIAPVAAGPVQHLSAASTRVEAGHDGVIVFDDAGTLRLGNPGAGFRTSVLGAGVTGFRLTGAGNRAVFATANGLYVSASF